MKKIPFLTATMLLLSMITIANAAPQKSTVWKMTYSSLNAEQSARFCVNVLGLEQIPIPDPTLAKGRSWVKFPDSGLELHFVDARGRYGYEKIKEYYEYMDALDQDMTVFTTFMDNHGAILVDDLTPFLEKLTHHQVPFLGPVRRADGVYQLYIEIPGHTYLEFDSKKSPPSLYPTTTWDKVPFSPSGK